MSKPKALILDDESDIVELMQFFLEEHFDCTGLQNQKLAIEKIGAEKFDVILTDYKMPGLTGIDVLRKVDKMSPTTMMMMMTGAMVNFEEIAPDLLGKVNIIEKPFNNPKIVLETILSNLKKKTRTDLATV